MASATVHLDRIDSEATLTTDHAASSYGQLVLVLNGEAYGRGDELPLPEDDLTPFLACNVGDAVYHWLCQQTGYELAWRPGCDREEWQMARAFCSLPAPTPPTEINVPDSDAPEVTAFGALHPFVGITLGTIHYPPMSEVEHATLGYIDSQLGNDDPEELLSCVAREAGLAADETDLLRDWVTEARAHLVTLRAQRTA